MAMTARAIGKLLALGAVAWIPPGAAAAADPADWECEAGLCTALIPVDVAREEGVFDHGANLSEETDLERLTELELQSWREFRFVVEERARVSAETMLDRGYVPETWPENIDLASAAAVATLHSSLDGETYQPVDAGSVLPAASYLSVIVTQATQGLDGSAAIFYPAKWTLQVSTRRVVDAGEADQADPGLTTLTFEGATPVTVLEQPDIAAALEAELGCVGLECREPDDDPSAADGDGTPAQAEPVDPDAADAAASDAAQGEPIPAGDALAAELQTELARVGCYTAAIDGLWGPGSRRAMAEFNRRTGSDLAVDAATPRALAAVARVEEPVCAVD